MSVERQPEVLSLEERLCNLQQEFAIQAVESTDLYIRTFNERIPYHLETNPVLLSHIVSALDNRPHRTAGYAANSILRSVQRKARKDDPRYPLGRETPEGWDPDFDNLFEDTTGDHLDNLTLFMMNLSFDVTSNIADRGKLLKLTALLNGKKGPVSIVDVGCSQNHILKKLALVAEGELTYPLASVEWPNNADRLRRRLTANRLAKLVHSTLEIGESVGIDLLSPNDPEVRDWAESCSFYPGEFLDTARTAEYARLVDVEVPQVRFLGYDIANDLLLDHFAKKFPELYRNKLDIAYFSTMLYQLTDAERLLAIENVTHLLKPDGIIVIQDFVKDIVDGKIEFHENWAPWTYGVWVYDLQDPDLGFVKYFSVENGRANTIRFEPIVGRLAVGKMFKSRRL